MEMINKAFEGADQFAKMMEKLTQADRPRQFVVVNDNNERAKFHIENRGYETRTQRRARERAELKSARKAKARV